MRPLLAIVPAFNEGASIGGTLTELRAVRPDIEVLVVDDGSSDDTTAIALSLGVRVLQLPFNLGIGGALQTGFLWAVRNNYQRAIQFDADGQHDPTQIENLVAGLDSGANLVIGSRFAADDTYRVSTGRAGGMWALRQLIRMISGRHLSDTSSGFRAFDAEMLRYFSVNYPVEYMESTESLLIALNAGFKVHEVATSMRSRTGGQPSQRTLRSTYHFIRVYLLLLLSAGFAPPRVEGR